MVWTVASVWEFFLQGRQDPSSPTRGQTQVCCIARRILNLWTTGDIPSFSFLYRSTNLANQNCSPVDCPHCEGPQAFPQQLSLSIWSEVKWESLSCVRLFATPWTIYSLWNSPGQNTGVGSLSLLQGIFPTQGSNLGLPYCRQILYHLSYIQCHAAIPNECLGNSLWNRVH